MAASVASAKRVVASGVSAMLITGWSVNKVSRDMWLKSSEVTTGVGMMLSPDIL